MKRYLSTLLFSFLLLVFSGCLKVDLLVKVNTDGSGTVEETVLMSKMVTAMINQFSSSFADDSTEMQDEFSLFNEEELISNADKMGEGVSYLSGEKISTESFDGYKAVYEFRNINNLKVSNNPASDIPMGDVQEKQNKSEFITFIFKKGSPAELTIISPENQEKDESDVTGSVEAEDSTSEDMMNNPFVTNLLSDFSMKMGVQFNGVITETDATYSDNNSITLVEINFSDLMDDKDKLSTLSKLKPGSTEEAKELLKTLPGVKVELNNKTTVKFR